MRYPYAARTLGRQMQEMFPGSKMEASGTPDGFGVAREVKFTGEGSKWLADALAGLTDDKRIASFRRSGNKTLVTFSTLSRQADDASEFPLEAAHTVAGLEQSIQKAADSAKSTEGGPDPLEPGDDFSGEDESGN